jgi:hypothetical protein
MGTFNILQLPCIQDLARSVSPASQSALMFWTSIHQQNSDQVVQPSNLDEIDGLNGDLTRCLKLKD